MREIIAFPLITISLLVLLAAIFVAANLAPDPVGRVEFYDNDTVVCRKSSDKWTWGYNLRQCWHLEKITWPSQ